jgi:catechol 2,3-dioxygenase-like lactoylglutathione lyase family enzyme
MLVKNLNHVNIQTRDMAGTIGFYEALLGLEARVAPERDPSERQWLYDSRGMAVIHLNLLGTDNTVERLVEPGAPTGAIHHVAFECEGFDDMLGRLKAKGVDYGFHDIAEIRLKQLFVTDPNNVLLELNFRY